MPIEKVPYPIEHGLAPEVRLMNSLIYDDALDLNAYPRQGICHTRDLRTLDERVVGAHAQKERGNLVRMLGRNIGEGTHGARRLMTLLVVAGEQSRNVGRAVGVGTVELDSAVEVTRAKAAYHAAHGIGLISSLVRLQSLEARRHAYRLSDLRPGGRAPDGDAFGVNPTLRSMGTEEPNGELSRGPPPRLTRASVACS